MKKFLNVMLVVVLAVFCLVACSNKNVDDDITTDKSVITEDELATDESVITEDELITDEGIITEDELTTDDGTSDVTIYANGGTIWMGANEPYEANLSVASIEKGLAFSNGIDPIGSIEKDGATFVGWTVYAVDKGEWLSEEATELEDGQLCVPCGEYGYYLMNDYELLSESATTEDMMAYVVDGRDYYAYAIWE